MLDLWKSPLRVGVAMLTLACGASHAPAAPAVSKSASSGVESPAPSNSSVPLAVGEENIQRVKLRWEVAFGGHGRGVAVSRGLDRVAASSGSPIHLFRWSTGKSAGTLGSCSEVVRGGLSFARRKLLVVCRDAVELWDVARKKRLDTIAVHASPVTASSLRWPRLALGHHDGVVRIYGLDGSPTLEIPVPGPPIDVKSLALTPDGSRIAVAWVQGSVWWWETAHPGEPHKLVRHANESDTVAFSHDGKLFAEEGASSFSTVWSFESPPKKLVEIRNGDWIKRLLFTRDSRWLLRGGSDGLELAEVQGPRRIVLDTQGAVEDVSLDEHAHSFAAVDRKGRLSLWAPR